MGPCNPQKPKSSLGWIKDEEVNDLVSSSKKREDSLWWSLWPTRSWLRNTCQLMLVRGTDVHATERRGWQKRGGAASWPAHGPWTHHSLCKSGWKNIQWDCKVTCYKVLKNQQQNTPRVMEILPPELQHKGALSHAEDSTDSLWLRLRKWGRQKPNIKAGLPTDAGALGLLCARNRTHPGKASSHCSRAFLQGCVSRGSGFPKCPSPGRSAPRFHSFPNPHPGNSPQEDLRNCNVKDPQLVLTCVRICEPLGRVILTVCQICFYFMLSDRQTETSQLLLHSPRDHTGPWCGLRL